MLSVSGADHIITMDLHASQIQVGFRWGFSDATHTHTHLCFTTQLHCNFYIVVAESSMQEMS